MKKTPILIANPKAASTSLRTVLPGVKVHPINRAARNPLERHIHHPLHSKWMTAHVRRSRAPFIFGVVRDPLDRFVSAYAYFQRKRKRTVPENYVLEAVLQGGDINAFVAQTDFELLSKIIPHFRRQRWFFKGEPGPFRPDFVLRFENLQDDFEELKRRLGANPAIRLEKRRATKHLSWQETLSDGSVQKLIAYYSRDYDEFNYSKPTP